MLTPREQLAETLEQARKGAGYGSQRSFASHVKLSAPVISKAENPVQPVPTDSVLVAYAGATGASLDQLTDLAQRAKSGTPEWFMSYRAAEAEASVIRSWAPLIVPGLAQTESYARAVLSVEPYTAEHLTELVDARIERQEVLNRAYATVIVAHAVLLRCIGSAAVMAEQCAHLGALAEHSSIALHVVPEGTNTGAWGALDIASHNGLVTVNFSTATDDVPTTATEQVDRAMVVYERILGYALPALASLDLIREQEEQWKACM